jgi:hypothetical protein
VNIEGVELDARFRETGSAASAHTGRQLIAGEFQFEIRDPAQQHTVAASLSERRSIDAPAVKDSQPVRFRVRSNSYRSVGDGPPWQHSVEVEEVESVNPEEIVVDGLSLRPYTYEERVEDGGGIVIRAHVNVDHATRQKLETKLQADDQAPGSYFDVVRTGIQDTPRRMRFGRCFWSEHDADTKYDLTLVEKTVDDSHPLIPGFYPELPNMRRDIALARNLISALLDSLIQSGSLSVDEKSAIEERAKAGLWQRHWSLFKLENIDNV